MSGSIVVPLSSGGLRKAASAVGLYATSLPAKADAICERLAEIGVSASVAAIRHDETGQLRSSIRFESRGDAEYVVIADSGYAAYVEFGTGQVGAASEYPGRRPEGVPLPDPDAGHPPDGGWVYYDERRGDFRITSGQQAQGFMAQGAKAVRDAVASVAREVLAQ